MQLMSSMDALAIGVAVEIAVVIAVGCVFTKLFSRFTHQCYSERKLYAQSHHMMEEDRGKSSAHACEDVI